MVAHQLPKRHPEQGTHALLNGTVLDGVALTVAAQPTLDVYTIGFTWGG